MATTDTDLLQNDPVLLSLIKAFSETQPPRTPPPRARQKPSWSRPFTLNGFPRFRLRERFVVDDPSDALIWMVEVEDKERTDSSFIRLGYGMSISELGYAASERRRCQRRLKSLAEAHLRAHLHMLECGLASSPAEITFLDELGRARSSDR